LLVGLADMNCSNIVFLAEKIRNALSCKFEKICFDSNKSNINQIILALGRKQNTTHCLQT